MIPYPDLHTFPAASTRQISWLMDQGIDEHIIMALLPLRFGVGIKAHDGRFDPTPSGTPWLVFPESEDVIFWQPRTDEFATWNGRAFALGEDAITNPATYSFDCNLNLLSNPIEWLRKGCDGIVIVDWTQAWPRLQHTPRIAVSEDLLFLYKRYMRPPVMPDVSVIATGKAVAA